MQVTQIAHSKWNWSKNVKLTIEANITHEELVKFLKDNFLQKIDCENVNKFVLEVKVK